jgi:RNA polymerase sigma-70 factor (ECF subfamily)
LHFRVLSGVTAKALDGAFPGDAAWRAVRAEGHTPRTSLMSETPPNTSIDPTLPLRAKAGDRQAFAQLVDVMYPRSLRFALHMVGNREDAEEAVQDAFIRVYHNLGRFRDDARFEPWLFRILANRCRSLMEKRRRHSVLIQYGELPERYAAAAEAPDRDWSEEIYKVLATLPTEQREAFLLRHVEDMAYEDIAAVTGVGLSALRMRVKRACDVLRARLSEVIRDE